MPPGITLTYTNTKRIFKKKSALSCEFRTAMKEISLPVKFQAWPGFLIYSRSDSANKSIPWEYLPDGCFARAQVACDSILKKGVNCVKLFSMVDEPTKDLNSDPAQSDRFRASNRFTKGEWWDPCPAAPVFAKDDITGKVDGYVLDPSMSPKGSLKATDWVKTYWSQDFPIKMEAANPDEYDPPAESFYPVNHHEFSQENFLRHMDRAQKTNSDYAAIIKEIKRSVSTPTIRMKYPKKKDDNMSRNIMQNFLPIQSGK